MRRLTQWPLIALFMVVVVALTASACGGDDDKGTTGKFQTLSEGKLRVGSDIPYQPFEFGDAPNYQGFDVDVVDAVAKKLDLTATFVKTPFDTIFRNLAQGKFDMVASATTITAERKKEVDFSDPYFPADQSLTVKAGSDIKSVEDLAGKRVGAQLGTTGADYAKKNTDAETVRTYDLVDDAFNALNAGQIDAAIVDFPVAQSATEKKKELELVATIPTGEVYGLGFKKDNDALRVAVNKALADMKEDGTYTRIFKKWFKQDPPQSILDIKSGEAS